MTPKKLQQKLFWSNLVVWSHINNISKVDKNRGPRMCFYFDINKMAAIRHFEKYKSSYIFQ